MDQTTKEWLEANAPGGWIDNLRVRVKELETENAKLRDEIQGLHEDAAGASL